mmetsp:Transcript_29908/g.51677  ORF Transcript_29908/g.51677 Transcript_29908/m.51677 type:complete len:194 (+) Transcript_29908:89-670(+)
MKSSAPIICLPLLLTVTILVSPSHAVTHQVDYNGERGEYCYNESFNLGTCLGKQQQDKLDLTNAQIMQCMECSGNFHGDETSCADLKALNDIELDGNGTGSSINWHESFCETYDVCVEKNCPQECLHEQDAWLECLIIELDCDWRCPGSTWLGGGTMGLNKNGAAVGLSPRGAYNYFVWGVLSIGGAFVGWTL